MCFSLIFDTHITTSDFVHIYPIQTMDVFEFSENEENVDISILRRPPKQTVNENKYLKYEIVKAKRFNTEYLYVFSEKRFYTFNATSKKGKTYRCHNRSCKSRIILQPDNLCVKLCTAHEHSCEKDCEEDFKKLSAIQAMKLKCIDIGSVASGKRMTAARSIYKDVIAQPE